LKFLIAFIILLNIVPTISSSQEWRFIHPYKGINIYSEVSFSYNDNVFKYSQDDINCFVNNIEPYKYPIETYDDFITTVQLHSKIKKQFAGSNLTTLNLKLKGNLYLRNKEKSYETFSVSIYQKLGRKGNAIIKYLFLPEYFIRYYPDFDVITPYGYPYYTGCYFSKHYLKLQIGYKTFFSSDLALYVSGEKNDYNDSFNEYDSEKKSMGIRLKFPVRKFLESSISYTFTRALASAVDESGEKKNTSDDSDISNDEDQVGFSLRLDLTKKLPIAFLTELKYKRRVYTTEKPILCDPYHSGREDKGLVFQFTTSITPTPRLSFNLGYTLENRDVFSPYDITSIEEIKNYSANLYSFMLTFSY